MNDAVLGFALGVWLTGAFGSALVVDEFAVRHRKKLHVAAILWPLSLVVLGVSFAGWGIIETVFAAEASDGR